MPIPQALVGDTWTAITARNALPIVVRWAQQGESITYGQLDAEIVKHGLGHHVLAVQYGSPAGAMGNALIELEERWNKRIPPLNAIIVNAKDRLPGKGVNYYLKHYFKVKKGTSSISLKQRRAVVEEIQADVFAFKHWDRVLRECELERFGGDVVTKNQKDDVAPPKIGGWSTEPESQEHRQLKEYVANNPSVVGLPRGSAVGRTEYLFPSADSADVVFTSAKQIVGVEVKSRISNDADLNRGIFQAVKYQALLRAEQRARFEAPTATAMLVSERALPAKLAKLAAVLGIEVIVVRATDANNRFQPTPQPPLRSGRGAAEPGR